jgi:hypothetical protein
VEDDEYNPGEYLGILGPVEGSGSLSAASGSTTDSRSGSVGGGMSLSGVLLDGGPTEGLTEDRLREGPTEEDRLRDRTD